MEGPVDLAEGLAPAGHPVLVATGPGDLERGQEAPRCIAGGDAIEAIPQAPGRGPRPARLSQSPRSAAARVRQAHMCSAQFAAWPGWICGNVASCR